MNALASRFRPAVNVDEDLESNSEELGGALWGSQAGFGNLKPGAPPEFMLPNVANVCILLKVKQVHTNAYPKPTAFLQLHTDDHADPNCKIKIAHGTTTLAFRFKGGIIVAVDSRATAGSYIGEARWWTTLRVPV
jgi:20S proteasome subunit beta 5